MSRHIKTFMLLFAVSLLLPAVGFAKVTPAHKYELDKFIGDHKQHKPSAKEPEVDCEALKYHTAPIANANCPEIKVGKKTCYQCTCKKEFQFTCSSQGFVVPGYLAAWGSYQSSSHLQAPSLTSSQAGLASGSQVQVGGIANSWDKVEAQLASNGCTIGNTTLYASCDCASGFISSELLHEQFSKEFLGNARTITGKNTGKTITCYLDTFSCKNGRVKLSQGDISNLNTSDSTFTADEDNKYITYKGQSLLKNLSASNNMFCVTGATIKAPLYSSRPANTDCAKYHDNLEAKYYSSVKYGYFETECSKNNYCLGDEAMNDCIEYSNSPEIYTFDGFNEGSRKTCRAIIGCKTGIVENATTKQKAFCASVNASTGFVSNTYTITTPSNSTPQNCYKLSCNTSQGWTQAYLGSTKPASEFTTNSSDHYSYDVRAANSGSNTLVCRQPNGCRVDSANPNQWYNFACASSLGNVSGIDKSKELCWDGWLSLWAKVAGK